MQSITGGDEPTTLGTITVTADSFSVSLGAAFGGTGGGGGQWEDLSDQAPPVEDLDVDTIVIENNLGREFTAEELAAVQALATAIANISIAISQLSNTAQITLPNGNTITGAQLKAIWGEVDFTINPNGFQYANGTPGQGSGVEVYDRGVGVNIGHLAGYAAHGTPGMNYFVLHELSHMTTGAISLMSTLAAGGMDSAEAAQLERYTNDTALAIGNATGQTLLANPAFGYTGG